MPTAVTPTSDQWVSYEDRQQLELSTQREFARLVPNLKVVTSGVSARYMNETNQLNDCFATMTSFLNTRLINKAKFKDIGAKLNVRYLVVPMISDVSINDAHQYNVRIQGTISLSTCVIIIDSKDGTVAGRYLSESSKSGGGWTKEPTTGDVIDISIKKTFDKIGTEIN